MPDGYHVSDSAPLYALIIFCGILAGLSLTTIAAIKAVQLIVSIF